MAGPACGGHCPSVQQRDGAGGHSAVADKRPPRGLLHRHLRFGRGNESEASRGEFPTISQPGYATGYSALTFRWPDFPTKRQFTCIARGNTRKTNSNSFGVTLNDGDYDKTQKNVKKLYH